MIQPFPRRSKIVEEGVELAEAAFLQGLHMVAGEVLRLAREIEALVELDPAAEQILSRLFAQIANEAAFAREEEIASPEDMETAVRLGLNWPLGPLAITDLIGAERAAALLEELEREKGAAYRPAPLLSRR